MNDIKNIKLHISGLIKKELAKTDLWITRRELAEMAGVGQATIYNVLNGTASTDSMHKVAKILNIKYIKK